MRKIIYSCGKCGMPLDENNEYVEPPENYNPSDYQLSLCDDCHEEENRMAQVTRDMAIDAGDMSLEGQWIRW